MHKVRRLWSAVWPLLLLYLSILAFFWRVLTPDLADKMRFKAGDFSYISYTAHHQVAKALSEGSLPLWNPHVASGYPQCADPQSACFYPVSLLTALLSRGALTLDLLQLEAIFHFALAATFTYLFVRYLLHSRAAAFLSAVAFTFGGYLASYPPLQLVILESAVWLPLTLWMVTLAVDRRQARYLALGGAALAMPFLAGQPQMYVSVVPLTLAWLLYRARTSGLSWRTAGGYAALLLGIAGGLFAVQALPMMELAGLASRADISYQVASEGGFGLWELGGIVSPKVFGSLPLYVGLVTLALAGLAVTQGRGRFWLVAGFVALLFSLGKGTFLFDLIYLLQRLVSPGYLRNMERVVAAFSFALAVLAGKGLLVLEEGQYDVRVRRILHWVAIALIAALAPLYVLRASAQPPEPYTGFLNALVFIVLILIAARFLFREASSRAWARWGLAGLLMLDLFTINAGYFLQPYEQDPLAELETVRPVTSIPGVFRTQADALINGDYGNILGVENVDGDAPLQLSYYARLLQLDELRRLQLLNVHVVATKREMTHGAFSLLYEQDGVRVYTFHALNPRAYLVPSVRPAQSDEEAAQILELPAFDPANEAVVQAGADSIALPSNTPMQPGEGVEIVSRSPTRIVLRAKAAAARLLVYADAFYPGWQASVDGGPVTILRTNLALRGVVVPQGEHTIIFVYRPTSLYAGGAVTLATLMALVIWLAWPLLRRRRQAR